MTVMHRHCCTCEKKIQVNPVMMQYHRCAMYKRVKKKSWFIFKKATGLGESEKKSKYVLIIYIYKSFQMYAFLIS